MAANYKRDVSGNSCIYKYTYITTLQDSDLFYVGRHSSNKNPKVDKYRGSGKWVNSIGDKSKLRFEVIAYYNTFVDLEFAEQQLIDLHIDNPNCMNFNKVATGCGPGELNHQFGRTGNLSANYGNKHTLQSRQKMSIAIKANYKLNSMTQEHKDKISLSRQDYGKGVPRTEETKKKISEANKGKIIPKEQREKIRMANLGRKPTDEQRKNMSIAQLGKATGNKNPMSKLTEQQVIEIKRLLKDGNKGASLARLYTVSTSVISKIKTGKLWSHVEVLV